MLSLGNGNYYFHIPRCGGNYTIRTFNGLRLAGKKISKVMHHFGHKHGCPLHCKREDVQFSFVTLRDPLSWYRSFYRFRIYKHYGKNNMDPGHHLDFFIWEQAGGEIFDFDYFLNKVADAHPWGYVTAMFCRFFPFVTTFLWLPELTVTLPRLLIDLKYDSPVALPPKPKNESPKDVVAECSIHTRDRILHTERGLLGYLRRLPLHDYPYIDKLEV
jgi:hypothetical protein